MPLICIASMAFNLDGFRRTIMTDSEYKSFMAYLLDAGCPFDFRLLIFTSRSCDWTLLEARKLTTVQLDKLLRFKPVRVGGRRRLVVLTTLQHCELVSILRYSDRELAGKYAILSQRNNIYGKQYIYQKVYKFVIAWKKHFGIEGSYGGSSIRPELPFE